MAQSPRKVRELPDKDPLFVFFTNGAVTEELIGTKIENYDSRWGIETGFRVRDDFLIQTTTRNPVIRYFFFELAAMLFDKLAAGQYPGGLDPESPSRLSNPGTGIQLVD